MSAGISLGTVASVVGIAGGLNSMGVFGGGGGGGGSSSRPSSGQAQTAVDPFASHRGAMGDQYAAMMAPGAKTDPTQMPGYSQWMSGVLNPAMEASQGKLAAAGMSGSGAEKQELQKVGQQGYYGFMTDYMNRLATGSGATQNPAAGGQAMIGQGNQGFSDFNAGLGGVATGLNGLFGSGSSGGGMGGYGYNSAQTVNATGNLSNNDGGWGGGSGGWGTGPGSNAQ